MYENTIHIAVLVNAQSCSGSPIFASDQLSAPSWFEDQPPRVDPGEVARAQRQQHEDEEQRSQSRRRNRAMKYANGNAISASVTVTATAIQIVRHAIWR